MTISAAGRREVMYWEPSYPIDAATTFTGNFDEAAEAVSASLEDAVRLRMLRADVPVGSYLSGGLDSSLVASLGRRFAQGAFQTFSVRFEEADYDESRFQQLMVQRLGSEHHEILVGARDIAAVSPDVVSHTEQPVLRTAAAPLYLLSKLVHECGIKVVLTGEGADGSSPATTSSERPGCGAIGVASPPPRRDRGSSNASIPYLTRSPVAERTLAREYSAGTVPGGRAGLRPSDALAGHERAAAPLPAGVPRGGLGRGRHGALPVLGAGDVRAVVLAGPGPVSRDAHPADGLPAARPRAIACSWPTPSRAASPSWTSTSSPWPTACHPPSSSWDCVRSTSSNAPPPRTSPRIVPDDQAALPCSGCTRLRGRGRVVGRGHTGRVDRRCRRHLRTDSRDTALAQVPGAASRKAVLECG